jgi:DNA-binding MarR family transcriptional regulator
MDNDTVIRLRRVVLKLARQLNAASREEGLTPTQASVLGITTTRGPLSLAELTELEGINPTMLSRVIGKLDEFGLIKRLRDPDDFRAARVEVTPKGRGVYERITAQRSAVISESVTGLPAGQQAALIAALPALENLAEDLRDTVRRDRDRDRLRDAPPTAGRLLVPNGNGISRDVSACPTALSESRQLAAVPLPSLGT